MAILAAGALVAADLRRSAAMIAPLVLAGCLAYAWHDPSRAPGRLLALATIKLLTPAAHLAR